MKLVGRRPQGGGEDRARVRQYGGGAARAMVWATAVTAAAAALLIGVCSGAAAAAAAPAPPYLLALGGSASVGFQPTPDRPRGEATGAGYAEDLVPLEQQRWPGLTVAHLGCPGASTVTMLGGGGKCHYPEGSQLQAAQAFLRTHPTTVLVTVDIGFNDLLACLRHEVVDAACVDEGIATVHDQLAQILAGLRAATPSAALVVGVGHYDPYLGDYLRGPGGQAFAAASLNVMERLDATLRSDYAAAGASMADVASAFDLTDHSHERWSGPPTVPTDVAQTCVLTWMCNAPPVGHNLHPNDAGYRAIASAIADAVAGSPAKADAGP